MELKNSQTAAAVLLTLAGLNHEETGNLVNAGHRYDVSRY